jgi:hypothetical protein
MPRASDPVARFARFLARSEHSPPTIKNYRSDLAAFAVWFEGANGASMKPARITPTDLRQFKRWLIELRRLKPNAVNRKLGKQFDEVYRRTVSKLPTNSAATIMRDGHRDVLKLTPLDKLDEPASLLELRADVTARLPRVDLTEVLLEVTGSSYPARSATPCSSSKASWSSRPAVALTKS